MEDKRKQDLEDEMNRFEQEIAGNLPPPPKIPRTMEHRPFSGPPRPPFMMSPFGPRGDQPNIPFPRPPHMPPMFGRPPMDGIPPMQLPPIPPGLPVPPMMAPPPIIPLVPPPVQGPGPSGPGRSYNNRIVPPTVPLKNYDTVIIPEHFDIRSKGEGPSGESKRKKDKKKSLVRVAGGTVWEDESLTDWDPNDFRIFVGDLGNEVSDDALLRAFSRYPSLLKARVVRDKKTKKTKGFGFVSFKDPQDYLKAMREMNGKYVGNRPIKLRKSTWKDRNIQVAKKKEKEKKKLGLR